MLNLMMQAQKTGNISLEDDKKFESIGFATAIEHKEKDSSKSVRNKSESLFL
jgi:hypothetical protein